MKILPFHPGKMAEGNVVRITLKIRPGMIGRPGRSEVCCMLVASEGILNHPWMGDALSLFMYS